MANGGLGRGLSALMGNTETEVAGAPFESGQAGGSQGDVMEVPLAKIAPNPNQPRRDFDDGKLAELADSISKNGLIQPIVVRKHGIGYEIIAGERRYQASKKAGLAKVPVVVKNVTDAEMFKLALLENIQRDDLNPIEEARGYRKLIAMNGVKSIRELADLVSKSPSSISNTIRLLKLPEEVQEMVADGTLGHTLARAILSIEDDEKRVAIAKKAVDEEMTTHEVEDYVRAIKEAEEGVPDAEKQTGDGDGTTQDNAAVLPDIVEIPSESIDRAVARMRSAMHGGKVKLKGKNGRYKVEIPISSEEELDELLAFFPDVTS